MLSITKIILAAAICRIQFVKVDGWSISQIFYDHSYITDNLDDRFPYLKLSNGSYIPPRDYFNFTNVFQPTEDYLESVNIEEHLYDELRAMEFSNSIATMDQWHYSDHTELLASGKPEADRSKCVQDLNYIYERTSLNNTQHFFTKGLDNIQLLKYMDTWGRPPSETYHGHSYWVGSYRGCRMAHLREADMKFRYCWGKLRAKSWPKSDEMIPPTSSRIGLCLPRSCDTKFAQENNDTIHKLMLFNFSPLQGDRFNQLIDIYCLPNRDHLPFRVKMILIIIVGWISFQFGISLLASNFRISKYLSRHLSSITIQSSYAKFISDDPPPPQLRGRVDLRSFGVIRFFGSLAVCIGHCGCSFGWVFNSSSISLIEYRKLAYHIMPSLLKSMDLFMVMGGMMTAFTIANKFPAERLKSILKPRVYMALLLVRYLRLAPMTILVLYFMKALYPYLSEGPMWDYGTDKFSMQGQCQRSSWWRVLIFPILIGFKGNYYVHECLPVSWYLITDLKLAYLTPILIYLIHGLTPKLKWLLVMAMVLLSSLWQYHGYNEQRLIYFRQFFTYGQLYGINILSLTFGETGYFNPINRMYAVVIGLFAGYYLHRFANSKKPHRWPLWMRGFCFKALILYEIYDFFSPHMAQYNYQHYGYIPSEETIKLAMLIKPRLDALIFAIICLRLASDLAHRLMENTLPLYKLSKLCYCVFLIHAIIISYAVSANERSRPDSEHLQFVMLTTFVVSMSFIISFPLYLIFESPLTQILSNLMLNRRRIRVDSVNVDSPIGVQGGKMAELSDSSNSNSNKLD